MSYSSALRVEGKGVMTTKDGDVIHLVGSGAAKSTMDGSVAFRGSIYFQTTAEKYAHLNTIAGVHEYEVDSEGNAVNKVWERALDLLDEFWHL